MLFEVGETVVYPHHGAATIVEVKNRTIRGEKTMYVKLNVKQGDLTIEVPAGRGARPCWTLSPLVSPPTVTWTDSMPVVNARAGAS